MTTERGSITESAPLRSNGEAIRTIDMGPRALEYAENIHRQIMEIYARYGVTSAKELAALPREQLRQSGPDVQRLKTLLAELHYALAHDKQVEQGLRNNEYGARSVAAAEEVPKKYRTDAPTQFFFRLGKAEVAQVLGEDPHAELLVAEKIAAREHGALFNMQRLLAVAYAKAGDVEEAISIAERAGVSDSRLFLDALVEAYITKGQLDDALAHDVIEEGDGTPNTMLKPLAGELYAALYVQGEKNGIHELMQYRNDHFEVQSRAVDVLLRSGQVDLALALAREVEQGFGSLACLERVGTVMRSKKMDTAEVGREMFATVETLREQERQYDIAKVWVMQYKGKKPSTFTYGCAAVSLLPPGEDAQQKLHTLLSWAHTERYQIPSMTLTCQLAEMAARTFGSSVAIPYVDEVHSIRLACVENEDEDTLAATDFVYAKALVACGRKRDAEIIAQADRISVATRCKIYLALQNSMDPDDKEESVEKSRLLAEAEKIMLQEMRINLVNDQILHALGDAHAEMHDIPGTLRYAERVRGLWVKAELMSSVVESANDRKSAAKHLVTFREMITTAQAENDAQGSHSDEIRMALEMYMQCAVDAGVPNIVMDELVRPDKGFDSSSIVKMLLRHAAVTYKEAKKRLAPS